jgi:hypothetical protein
MKTNSITALLLIVAWLVIWPLATSVGKSLSQSAHLIERTRT